MKMHISTLAILALLALSITTTNSLQCPDDCTSPEHGTCDTETGTCKCNHGYSSPDNIANCARCDIKCNDGTCMVAKWCDTERDCPDGEDEDECCPKHGDKEDEKAECKRNGDEWCECDGSCMPQSQICNGVNNCCTTWHNLGSTLVTCADPKNATDFQAPDEEDCQCPNNDDFKCIKKGKQRPIECIADEKRCDGNDDCQDGSDESQLEANCCVNCAICGTDKQKNFTCKEDDGKLIPLKCGKQCDGIRECDNGLDEEGCPPPPPEGLGPGLIFLIILVVVLVIAVLGWLFWNFYGRDKYLQLQQLDLEMTGHK